MDIILFFIILSLLIWVFSIPSSTKRKTVKKDLKDAIIGGVGIGIVYAIIIVLFIIAVRFVIHFL